MKIYDFYEKSVSRGCIEGGRGGGGGPPPKGPKCRFLMVFLGSRKNEGFYPPFSMNLP